MTAAYLASTLTRTKMKGANKRIGLRKPGGVSKYLREATKHPAAATQSSHKLKPGEGKFPSGVYRSTQPAGKEDKNIPPLSQAERMKKMQLLGQVKKMLARLRTASSISHVELLQSWKKSFQADIIEQQSRSQHFRRPVEKLAHKVHFSNLLIHRYFQFADILYNCAVEVIGS